MSKNENNHKEWNLGLNQQEEFVKQFNVKLTKTINGIESCRICGITQDIGGCHECKVEKKEK